jgi:hypothetical protein
VAWRARASARSICLFRPQSLRPSRRQSRRSTLLPSGLRPGRPSRSTQVALPPPTRARASPSRFARPRTHAHAASPRADDGHREPRNAAPLLPRRPHRPLRAPASAAEISSDPFVQSPGSPAADTSTTRQSTHGVEVLWPVACKQALPAAIFASPLRPERILRCIYLYFTADRGKVPLPGRPSEPRNGRGVRRQQRVPRRWRGSSCSVCGQFFRAPVTTDQAPSPGF